MSFVRFCLQSLAALVLAWTLPVEAQPLSGSEIDALAARAMRTFSVPGMAIGVIKDGRVVHAKGYGVRQIGRPEPVGADTVFAIGSITKTFTAGAVALLVDQKKLSWDDKVIDHLPGFRLQDPWVTREATVRDILSHRLDLSLGAGGLMFYASSDFSRDELVANMRYFKPSAGFRSKFVYDNLAYVAAGALIESVAHSSYESFVDHNILQRVGMTSCASDTRVLIGKTNIAVPHAEVDGHVVVTRRLTPIGAVAPYASAGGIYCDLNGMMKYVAMHLSGGRLPSGEPLFSPEQHREMWTPQTLGSVSDRERDWDGMHFASYGLGWQVTDMHGYRILSHAGGVPGMRSLVFMIPDLQTGIVVLTNQEAREAMDAIAGEIAKSYMGQKRQDWVQRYADQRALSLKRAEALAGRPPAAGESRPSLPLEQYAGTYRDPWLGDVHIRVENGKLVFAAARAPLLTAVLAPVGGDVFVARWQDRTLGADAYVDFDVGMGEAPNGMLMKAVSPTTSLVFDFHDLNFRKLEATDR